jgi:hypothetical protein
MFIFSTITRDVYCCCRRGDGDGGGDPKGKNTNTTPDPKKMSTFERGMLRYMQGKTADAIAIGEDPLELVFMLPQTCIIICDAILQMPLHEERNLLMVVFMLRVIFTVLQQTRLLLIHQLKKVPRKTNLHHHITRMVNIGTLYEVVFFDHAVL